MTLTSRLTLLASASIFALSSTAYAQSTADLYDLGSIQLDGEIDPSDPVPGYVATNAQTATKTGTPILETQQSVSVITGEQIEDQGATTLGDTLGYTAGLTAQPFGTDPRFDSPTIRGFNGSDAQYLNGLRIMRDFGAPSFEIYSLERVEVLKGPSSVMYGSGIPGGVINQVQKRAQFVDFGEAGVGIGDPKATEGFVDWNHNYTDNFAARFTAVARDSEEDVEELTNQRGYLGVATRWDITDATTLQFLGSYQKDSPITPAGVPYDLIGQVNDKDLRSFYAGDPTDDNSDRETLNLGLELSHDLNENWSIDVGYRHQNFDWTYTGFYVNNTVADGDTITRGASTQFEDSVTDNLDARVAGTVWTDTGKHDLLFGLDLRRYEVQNQTDFMSADDISYSNPDYNGANLGTPWYTGVNDLTLTQFGIYAQQETANGNWRSSNALRLDRAKQTGTSSQEDLAATRRHSFSYLFDNGVAPYASYTQSFDPTVGSDIDGNALKPTEGEQYELGVKWEPTTFNGFFSAAVYNLTQSNLSATVTEGGISGIRQIGEVTSKGLELEGSVDLDNGWNIRGQYTWNETEQTKGDNVGNEMPNAPAHNASLWANYGFGNGSALEGLRVGGGVRYIGTRFGDAGNAYEMEDVTLLDLQTSYDVTEDIALSLNVSNLTDVAYVANCGSFGCYYGDGRTVQARMSYKW
ncbi:TonB-dependent siderophore receptor [Loktanella sp. S4079]|uniref:TonB-dependent siderophore receptor n=1 Tax=Loktanella sp. S4079 TaxID=579483 RepID=UPI0005FA707A|nr:TonB-dependent siderophore receptor [Loktanella sp. S4079]KJZ19335.1 ligand-gated channel [Loktanella sp. S4079]